MTKLHKIGWKTAFMLVISNMIGTGVFTSLGYQLLDVRNVWSIVLLWVLGGLLALIGAFTFAELGTYFKKSGGDYLFISKAFHPFWGYLSAWTSLIVGFSAPVAIAGLAMEAYLVPFEIPNLRVYIIAVILLISFFHTFSLKHSSVFQTATTVFKVLFVLFLMGLGIWYSPIKFNAIDTASPIFSEISKSGFAVSLLYVTYAYTGWNAAAYIVGEIHNPEKNLPKALLLGTLVVMIVYVLLQIVFLKFCTYAQLSGQAEVAILSIQNILGKESIPWISAGIGLQLVATMSSYIWIGPRVVHAMAQHYSLWYWLRPLNAHNIPVRAIWLQTAIILVLLLSGTLQQVLLYTSFLLQLMGTLAVASYFKIKRNGDGFKSPWSPYIQYFYVGFSIFVLVFIIIDKPFESLVGLSILLFGALTYLFSKKDYTDEG
jgi:APA family basic amino acid/polyamine antiporter